MRTRVAAIALLAAAVLIAGAVRASTASAAGPTLSASPANVAPGSTVTGTWAGIVSPATYDWVGLYASSSAADNAYLAWVYTGGGASGSKPLTVPASATPGSTYQLRLFANNGFTRLAKSNVFTVTAASSTPAGVGTDNYPAGGTGQFGVGECVDFVAWRLRQAGVTRNGVLFANAWGTAPNGMTRFGDAHNWDDYAGSLGYAVNTTPAVGAVAHFTANETVRIDKPDGSWRTISAGPSGHVAYVMKVNADGTVDLEEYNQNGDHKYHQQLGVKAPRYIHIK